MIRGKHLNSLADNLFLKQNKMKITLLFKCYLNKKVIWVISERDMFVLIVFLKGDGRLKNTRNTKFFCFCQKFKNIPIRIHIFGKKSVFILYIKLTNEISYKNIFEMHFSQNRFS